MDYFDEKTRGGGQKNQIQAPWGSRAPPASYAYVC